MIGNDVIDLRLSRLQSNWKRKGWLDKIFTHSERECIQLSQDPAYLVWKFWSMKEAAYKANQRRFPNKPIFSPKSFECSLEDAVSYKNQRYTTATISNASYIHTIAQSDSTAVQFCVFKDADKARLELMKLLSNSYKIPLSNFSIYKDQYYIPYIMIEKVLKKTSFSLTHHGSFSAYAVYV